MCSKIRLLLRTARIHPQCQEKIQEKTHLYQSRYQDDLCKIDLKMSFATYDDDDVYLEYYSGKGFHINYSVYMSYVKHISLSNKA